MSDENEMDDEDRAFLASMVPDDGLPLGFFAVAVWTEPDGELKWRFYDQLEMVLTNHIGLLELAKLEVIRRTTPSIYVGGDSDA
jgi:hypothetical protein